MKVFFVLNAALLLLMVPAFAMEKLAKDELSEVENRIKQIEFADQMGSYYFMGSGQTQEGCMRSQIAIIEKIFNQHSIQHPSKKTWAWLKEVKETLSRLTAVPQTSEKTCENQDECDISGLDKIDVLQALWEAARCGNYWPSAQSFSKEAARKALQANSCVDYLGGKPLKIDLGSDKFSTFLYNRDNGSGAAQRVIEALRKKS